MRVALIGGTGLTGSLLAPLLVAAGHDTHLVQRRPGGPDGAVQHVAPAADWPALVRAVAPEAVVCALGTTMRRAGSESAFAAVDRDLVLDFAAAARSAGARRFLLVSSVGADPASSNVDLALKGEVESALAALGFERLDLFRPGLLRGPRGPERRPGERLGILLSPLSNLFLKGPLDRFAAIDAAEVAAGIAAALNEDAPGTHVHHNRQIRRHARG